VATTISRTPRKYEMTITILYGIQKIKIENIYEMTNAKHTDLSPVAGTNTNPLSLTKIMRCFKVQTFFVFRSSKTELKLKCKGRKIARPGKSQINNFVVCSSGMDFFFLGTYTLRQKVTMETNRNRCMTKFLLLINRNTLNREIES
jgi:hypothetical protein